MIVAMSVLGLFRLTEIVKDGRLSYQRELCQRAVAGREIS